VLSLVDLGTAPPSNAYLSVDSLHKSERWFPLRVLVCDHCWLVQTEDFARAEDLFDAQYAYFSSYSTSWLAHAEHYVAEMVDRFGLTTDSHVVEIAANDGYLLQFVAARGIPCTGIEPTTDTAAAARARGIDVVEAFFRPALAASLLERGLAADLMIANNVLGHVPDINEFVASFTLLLKPHAVATFEFPHLQRLMEYCQFDTIYHEHFSYLSLTAAHRIFSAAGLTIFDVEELPTHGGSLRMFVQRADFGRHAVDPRVPALLKLEAEAGLATPGYYRGFQQRAESIKNAFLNFLLSAKKNGESVAAYGAAAKGNTLMNFAGIRPDLINFVAERNPAKCGKYMPGSRISIVEETALQTARPDYIVILPWNLRKEITGQLEYARAWGAKFVIAVPTLEVS
jgi:2-polyprenyl-3-methyl-5-hydroxy-6-metoxy-1,4-benzoquinol methylase